MPKELNIIYLSTINGIPNDRVNKTCARLLCFACWKCLGVELKADTVHEFMCMSFFLG